MRYAVRLEKMREFFAAVAFSPVGTDYNRRSSRKSRHPFSVQGSTLKIVEQMAQIQRTAGFDQQQGEGAD